MQVGDLVFTKLLNRWGLPCAGVILQLQDDSAVVEVFNVTGPGANWTGAIPLSELSSEKQN